jgi:hypothetical protein
VSPLLGRIVVKCPFSSGVTSVCLMFNSSKRIEDSNFFFQKEIKGKGKKVSFEETIISYSQINKATIIISFK